MKKTARFGYAFGNHLDKYMFFALVRDGLRVMSQQSEKSGWWGMFDLKIVPSDVIACIRQGKPEVGP
jgi:hypothetical protein